MDLEYYRDFLAIVEEQTIAGAARRLRIAPPALTHRLRQLEQHLGTPLLETARGTRQITLTEAGQYLYEEAQYLLAAEDNLRRKISHRQQGLAGQLAISLSPSTALMFIREYLVPFSRAYPAVTHRLHEVSIASQTEQLLSGMSEIGVANAPLLQPERFTVLERRKERLLVAAAHDYHWAGERFSSISLETLQDVPLVLSRGCSELFLQTCRRSGFQPTILGICTTRAAALMWAREKRACAIVPEQVMENFIGELTYTAIRHPNLSVQRSIVIVKHRPLTKVAANFLRFHHLQEEASNLQ